jgi:hypothetical protein
LICGTDCFQLSQMKNGAFVPFHCLRAFPVHVIAVLLPLLVATSQILMSYVYIVIGNARSHMKLQDASCSPKGRTRPYKARMGCAPCGIVVLVVRCFRCKHQTSWLLGGLGAFSPHVVGELCTFLVPKTPTCCNILVLFSHV